MSEFLLISVKIVVSYVDKTKGFVMKLLILCSCFYPSVASAFGAGYYEGRAQDCDPVAMQRAMDAATLRTGAGITVIRCDAGAANAQVVRRGEPAPRVVYVEPRAVAVDYLPIEYVEYTGPVGYVDYGCDCCL